MKSIPKRTNPAFKRTQPLPLLPADFAQRAGWAARTIAQAAGAWPAAAMRAAGAVVKPGLNVRATGLMG
jgi:hypothetical protein